MYSQLYRLYNIIFVEILALLDLISMNAKIMFGLKVCCWKLAQIYKRRIIVMSSNMNYVLTKNNQKFEMLYISVEFVCLILSAFSLVIQNVSF